MQARKKALAKLVVARLVAADRPARASVAVPIWFGKWCAVGLAAAVPMAILLLGWPRPRDAAIFTGDKIDGDRALPLGDALTARGDVDHESLIRWRAHFLPELLKSAENL